MTRDQSVYPGLAVGGMRVGGERVYLLCLLKIDTNGDDWWDVTEPRPEAEPWPVQPVEQYKATVAAADGHLTGIDWRAMVTVCVDGRCQEKKQAAWSVLTVVKTNPRCQNVAGELKTGRLALDAAIRAAVFPITQTPAVPGESGR